MMADRLELKGETRDAMVLDWASRVIQAYERGEPGCTAQDYFIARWIRGRLLEPGNDRVRELARVALRALQADCHHFDPIIAAALRAAIGLGGEVRAAVHGEQGDQTR